MLYAVRTTECKVAGDTWSQLTKNQQMLRKALLVDTQRLVIFPGKSIFSDRAKTYIGHSRPPFSSPQVRGHKKFFPVAHGQQCCSESTNNSFAMIRDFPVWDRGEASHYEPLPRSVSEVTPGFFVLINDPLVDTSALVARRRHWNVYE